MQIHHAPEGYQAKQDLLDGRTILVTGAGDGIGKAAALSYAAHGATVILLGRTVEKLESVYDAIETAGGAKPAIVPLDLQELTAQGSQALAEQIAEEFGALHGLLHNASLLGERRSIASANYTAWEQVMQVNVNAQFLLTRYLLPVLDQAEQASIILTSSGVGHKGRAFWGAYAVSKFATEGFMQVLADELENISQTRVNSLNPGGTRTAMRASAYPAENPSTKPAPADIMATYLYLMGDDSIGVSGKAFNAQRQ